MRSWSPRGRRLPRSPTRSSAVWPSVTKSSGFTKAYSNDGPGSKPAAARIVFQGRNDDGTTEAQSRQPSQHQAREETDPENDRDHGKIDPQFLLQLCRYHIAGEPGHERRTVEEHQRREHSARARHPDRLGQEILSQPCPAGTNRLADRQLALAHRATHLHHARDIQGDDQQHHAGDLVGVAGRVAADDEAAERVADENDARAGPQRDPRAGPGPGHHRPQVERIVREGLLPGRVDYEAREAGRYDGSMRGYAAAGVESQVSLAWLNFGQALIITAVLVGIGGAYLSIAQSAGFNNNMSAGRGYIALAALIFAKWRPGPALLVYPSLKIKYRTWSTAPSRAARSASLGRLNGTPEA